MHACIIHWVLAFETLHCRMLSSSCLLDFAKKSTASVVGKLDLFFWFLFLNLASKLKKKTRRLNKLAEKAGEDEKVGLVRWILLYWPVMRAVFPTSLPGPWCCKALGGAPTAAAASDDDVNPCLEEEENKRTTATTLSFLNKKLLLPWVLHSPSTHLTIAATTTTQTPNPTPTHTHTQNATTFPLQQNKHSPVLIPT